MKKQIQVVGAVIQNETNEKILCALRSANMSLPNLWEFPGGKIEPGEKPEAALKREIDEELGCEIQVKEPVESTTHEYEQIIVHLHTFNATIKSGTPKVREHAELKWLDIDELETLEWAPADIPAIHKIMREHQIKKDI